MSAIYGRMETGGGPLTPNAAETHIKALAEWGPDSLDVHATNSWIIAQATLFIAPNSHLNKIEVTNSGCYIAADAILDNRPELAELLGVNILALDGLSDAGLIAASWERWGSDCVQHLVGDFAFSVVDPAARTVFLARDHIGTRPLYWSIRGDTFLWCTAANVLVNHTQWQWPIDEDAVAAFQAYFASPLHQTFFQHVQRVEPGHTVNLQNGKVSTSRWWKPKTIVHLRLETPQAYAEACRALVERAVADRSKTVYPIGAHLSGGIDSTGVAVIAARYLAKHGRRLVGGYAWSPPYSEEFPDMGARDERRRIAAVGEKENIPIQFGSSNGQNLFNFFIRPLEIDGIADLADEVPILANAGVDQARIVLSGWGGDEGFSSHGVGYLGYLLTRFKFSEAADHIRGTTRSLKKLKQVAQILWWDGFHPCLPAPLYHLFNQYKDRDSNCAFIRSDRAINYKKIIKARQKAIKFGLNPAQNIKRYINHGHIAMRMETWAAWSAPYGIQYRYPLTDRRLLEFLMSIPPEALYPDGRSRGLALGTLADVIPPDVTKYDAANEAYREKARIDAWGIAADQAAQGMLDEDCPWFEMPALRKAALNPVDQSTSFGIMRFAELMTALRLWFMWKRHNGG
jgi:asparagine synthase (glutamine-hydrolysing)